MTKHTCYYDEHSKCFECQEVSEPSTSFAVQVTTDGSGKWYGPAAIRFSTREQASEYAQDLFMRWSSVREWRVVGC